MNTSCRVVGWSGPLSIGAPAVGELTAGAPIDNGPDHPTTLHDVFMTYTGRSLDEDFEEPRHDDD